MSKNISQLSKRKGLENNLFNKIVGDEPKPLKAEDKKALAEEFLLGEATIQGSASFYDMTKDEAADIKIRVCNGSSCLCADTQSNVSAKLAEHFAPEQIGHITCLGRCHDNKAFYYQGENYSGDDIQNIDSILNGSHCLKEDSYQAESLLNASLGFNEPVLMAEINDVEEFYAPLNQLIASQQDESTLQQVIDSNLRGRGGAGFPTGIKWKSCRDTVAEEKYIVCNADEGDPGAYSDRYLLEQQAERVLYGMLLAGWLCGAQWGVLYIRAEYPQAIRNTENAIKKLRQLGMLGQSLNQQGFQFDFKIVKGAGAYICGEETALIRSIEGQRPVVSVRPPFPTVSGLFECPTVVNNVESFAFMPWIIEHGGKAFSQIGTERSTGTKLVSLDSAFNRPGIYEVAMGTPLQDVIEQGGQGFSQPIKAMHIGGPLGGLVPSGHKEKLNVDFESFQSQGFLLGHASVVGIPESMPLIDYLHHLFEFTADESCGKCFPCRLGATRGKEMLAGAKAGKKLNRELLDDLLETLQLGSLCALGGGLPLPIQNALAHFPEELQAYFEQPGPLAINVVEAI
jgi:NADH:ubiquinone oxidoreductase subunit F (NADH-binding)